MRTPHLSALAVLFLASSSWAGDFSLLKEYVGNHPVLSYNDTQNATGMVRVVADQERVGFELIALPWSTNAVDAKVWTTPSKFSKLEKDGSFIIQTYFEGEKETRIEYQIMDGFLVIGTTDCGGPVCNGDNLTLSTGKSIGAKMDAKAFFEDRAGTYKTITAGGIPAKPSTAEIEIIPDGDIVLVVVPYCHKDGWCDPGDLYFEVGKTTVFKRVLSQNHVVYDIFANESPTQQQYYRWEEREKTNVFKNTQYLIEGGTYAMEHEMELLK